MKKTNSLSPAMKLAVAAAATAIFFIFTYAGILVWLTYPIDKMTIANAGVFGDSFGVLTSLFSAFAFGGVAVTIAIQRETLALQKTELEQQKDDLALNRRELHKQGFENTFFQMLKLHNQILGDISTSQGDARGGAFRLDGRVVFNNMKKEFEGIYFKGNQIYAHSQEAEISHAFQDFYRTYGHQLGHYFRFLYNILRFLSESKLDDKILYSRLLRAQLSNQELALIYYNALTPNGKNLIIYMQEFKLMDNLEPAYLRYESHTAFIKDVGFPPF